jgi:hypothetical protein
MSGTPVKIVKNKKNFGGHFYEFMVTAIDGLRGSRFSTGQRT